MIKTGHGRVKCSDCGERFTIPSNVDFDLTVQVIKDWEAKHLGCNPPVELTYEHQDFYKRCEDVFAKLGAEFDHRIYCIFPQYMMDGVSIGVYENEEIAYQTLSMNLEAAVKDIKKQIHDAKIVKDVAFNKSKV